MEKIFRALVTAISNIVVLCGGDAISIDEGIFGDVKNWLVSIGVTFEEDKVA